VATVFDLRVSDGRRAEIALLALAVTIAVSAYAIASFNAAGALPDNLVAYAGIAVLVAALLHTVVRKFAPYADPVLLPCVIALNGLGLAMIHRIDIALQERGRDAHFAPTQAVWSLVGVALALAVIMVVKDHRSLRKYTYTAGIAGIVALLLPLVPGLGREVNGARIWIGLFGRSLQPGEFAKIALVIFFAGYLVSNRDALTLAGPKVLGLRLPRARDLGPLAVVWVAALVIQIAERDLGTSLLVFGIFVAMLYVATERVSWVVVGLSMFLAGAVLAGTVFAHVGARYDAWLHALDYEVYASGRSEQLVRGLFGMANGGLFGTGLGEGRPDLVPLAQSDFIVPSLGEELGLTGLMAIFALYVIIVQRAMRAGIGVRDGFGKLLAAGLGFAIALQVFIVVGGVTRVVPLTGLTTPFVAYGGSSMIANWIIVALLLRLSNGARRAAAEEAP